MKEISIGGLIRLLAFHPRARYFDRLGHEFSYNAKRAMFRYDGWDSYNDCPDTRIRHLRKPERPCTDGDEYWYARATVDGSVIRLWTGEELGRIERTPDPEMTLSVVEPVDLESETGRED